MTEDPHLFTYFILFGLLVLSAFFSSSEVAFVSLSPAKVRLLEDKKSRAAKLVIALKNRPQRLLATILIGNNLVNIFAAGLATVVATDFFGSLGLGIATGLMTLLILIFGEIFPKAFAQKHAQSFALFAAYPLFILDKILIPFTWSIEKTLHLLGAEHIERVSEKEIVAAVDLGTESGEIKKHEQELIQNVLEFTDTRVEEVMTPRVEIEALEKVTTVAEAEKFFREKTCSRLPIFDSSIDKVIGILNLRQLFGWEGSRETPVGKLPLAEAVFTPASRTTRSLFKELQSRNNHLAIVVDEHGGTLGLVTLEDLLEEIVGEIEDEQDVAEESIQKVNAHTILAAGDTPLWEIDKILGAKLERGRFDGKNVAFLLLEKLAKMPAENAKIRVENVELTVEKVHGNRIEKVKIEKI
ncbi:MAG: hemolysin family protein [Candidatus Peribacteraceae bacterium]|nr:hemolysin family protein [Candidatus Peribacteraceae bacterium]